MARLWVATVFDDVIMGTGAAYSSPDFNDNLGKFDKIAVHAVVDQVTGTGPTFTLQLEHSGDGRNWLNMNTTAEINAVSISVSAVNSMIGVDSGSVPTLAFVRARVQLGGGATGARVKVHACLRDGD